VVRRARDRDNAEGQRRAMAQLAPHVAAVRAQVDAQRTSFTDRLITWTCLTMLGWFGVPVALALIARGF